MDILCINRQILQTEQKALEINLNSKIYGTFSEIGAGQEVARNFFQAGGAAGTIAKTMSAYDKTYSDAIYGIEESKRYVCESRLYKMLDHEYGLMEERLLEARPDTKFFVFADTVSAINYQKTIKGQGWLGVRFQLSPDGPTNDLVLHTNMKDNDNRLQQEAIGVLGVNMIYACYFYNKDPKSFIDSLLDGIRGRVEIDMISLTGPDFDYLDNRLLSLYLVQYGLTEVAIFNAKGNNIHGSEFLYKKNLMVVRGHFRPPTLVTMDVVKSGFDQFVKEKDVDEDRACIVTEVTLDNLNVDGEIDEDDFISRVKLLSALDQTVVVSNCSNHQGLINYLSDFKIKNLGLVIGVNELKEIVKSKYENNLDGRLLVAFGELFNRNINVYVYPAVDENKNIVTASTMPVPDGIKFLYKHLIDSKQIIEITDYNKENLTIFPYHIYDLIATDENNWENALPAEVASLIKKEGLLGYKKKILEQAE